ncbi:MAG: transaldolase [Gammaproteobacteria bacterium]|nr:transaldolase [Gammaproteobacteria bacterium]
MNIKIFVDSADAKQMLQCHQDYPQVVGFTTNPTLLHQAGVTEYEKYARDLLSHICDFPISFEIFADDFDGMIKQARQIAAWGENVYVKIPVTNTKGEFTGSVIEALSKEGIKLNVTAIFLSEQVKQVAAVLADDVSAFVSIFAGRIADVGIDPLPIMQQSIQYLENKPMAESLWASTREAFNMIQAEQIGCDIITMPHSLIKKVQKMGKDLQQCSLDAVKSFYQDAKAAGLEL